MLAALLSIPVELALRLQLDRGYEGQLTIGWLFGLVHIPVHLHGEKSAERRRKQPRKRKKRRAGARRNIFISRDFWQWLRRVMGKLMKRIQIVRLFLHVRLGLGDPADTGRLWAVTGPVAALLGSIPLADLRLEPNFMEAEFVLHGEGEIRFYPIMLIATALATLLSPTTWRVFRQKRSA